MGLRAARSVRVLVLGLLGACGGSGSRDGASDALRAWVVVADDGSPAASRVLRSEDDGASWSAPLPVPLPPGEEVKGIAFRDRTRGFLLATDDSILATDDGGDSWRVVYGPDARADRGLATLAIGPGDVVAALGAVLEPGRPDTLPAPLAVVSEDDAASWAEVVSPDASGAVEQACSTDDGATLAVGRDGAGIASGRRILRAASVAEPLAVVALESRFSLRAEVACAGAATMWVLGFDVALSGGVTEVRGGLWTSSDAGLDWEDRLATLPAGALPVTVDFADPQHGWLVTTDGGTTWRTGPLPEPLGSSSDLDVRAATAEAVVLVSSFGPAASHWSVSHDGGASWAISVVPGTSPRRGVVAFAAAP